MSQTVPAKLDDADTHTGWEWKLKLAQQTRGFLSGVLVMDSFLKA